MQCWSKFGPKCRVFSTGAENKEESSSSQKFAHSLFPILGKISLLVDSPSKGLFSSTKYQLSCFNPIKTSFLGFYLLPLLLLHFILTLYSLYSQVMLTSKNVPCYRMLLTLEKFQIVKITPHQIPTTRYKNSFIANFAIALT